MERRLREELEGYFEAPKPERKRVFVRQFGMQKMNLLNVVAGQARYISKGVWIFSVCFFGMACAVAQIAEPRYVSMILAIIPFLVMCSVTETTRSYRYGMEELELSVRFSLKSVVLARMVVLGLGNLAVLAGAMLLLRSHMHISIACVMAPYFLTAGGSLYIVRNLRGTEGVLPCLLLASLVCVLELYLPWQLGGIFSPEYAWAWGCACMVGIIITVREGYQTIRMTEGLV